MRLLSSAVICRPSMYTSMECITVLSDIVSSLIFSRRLIISSLVVLYCNHFDVVVDKYNYSGIILNFHNINVMISSLAWSAVFMQYRIAVYDVMLVKIYMSGRNLLNYSTILSSSIFYEDWIRFSITVHWVFKKTFAETGLNRGLQNLADSDIYVC